MWHKICKIYVPNTEVRAVNAEDVNLYVDAVHKDNIRKNMGMKRYSKGLQKIDKIIDYSFWIFLILCIGFLLGRIVTICTAY